MKIVFWLLGACVVALALSVPLTARGAELSPPEVGAFERGLAALEEGDDGTAFASFLAVSRRHPEHARAMRLAGSLADGMGDRRAALAYSNAALLADPFSGEVWGNWGRQCLRALGAGD